MRNAFLIALAFAVVAAARAELGCQGGRMEAGDKCYELFDTKLTYESAMEECTYNNGTLASFPDGTWNTLTAGDFLDQFPASCYVFWIGVNDRDNEGVQRWPDPAPVNDNHWCKTNTCGVDFPFGDFQVGLCTRKKRRVPRVRRLLECVDIEVDCGMATKNEGWMNFVCDDMGLGTSLPMPDGFAITWPAGYTFEPAMFCPLCMFDRVDIPTTAAPGPDGGGGGDDSNPPPSLM